MKPHDDRGIHSNHLSREKDQKKHTASSKPGNLSRSQAHVLGMGFRSASSAQETKPGSLSPWISKVHPVLGTQEEGLRLILRKQRRRQRVAGQLGGRSEGLAA